MAKILIVEDDQAISMLLAMNLKLAGHNCDKAYDGISCLKILTEERYDLVLLDIMLPGIDGFEVIKQIKTNVTPVIFISAKDALSDKIEGFDLGADDYITKPFEFTELLARINVTLRRSNKLTEFTLDDVRVNIAEKQVYISSQPVDMTIREFSLLEVLIENRNIALSREKLLLLAWGYDYEGDTRTVDAHIVKLRKKLNWENRIKTVYKVGYRLEV